MASLRTLRTKIKSVKSTQQITKAMKMVAAARLNRAQQRMFNARPFADELEVLMQELAYLLQAKGQTSSHPLMAERTSKRVDIVLVTADRGLCGGFNTSLIRHLVHDLQNRKEDDVRLWLVGKKGRDYFRRLDVKIEKEYAGIFQRLGFGQADILGTDIINTFLKTDTREFIFIYNEFKSRIQQKLITRTLLPLKKSEEVQPKLDFIYEPNQKELLDSLRPRYIKAQIYRILLESQAAELAARMAAMDSATKNANDLIYSLTLTMNKVRQAAITKEISEIVGGVEALANQ